MEIWRNVVGYEGIYEVSNYGFIRTHKDKVTYTEMHKIRHWKQRVLKQKTDKNGYKRVSLWLNGKEKTWSVHRVVATAFLDKDGSNDIINHKDGNPSNNNVDNIEWCDYRHNLLHAFKNGLNNSRHKVELINYETSDVYHFESKREASEFLGRNKGFVSNSLKLGKAIVGDYEILSRR